MLLDELHAQRQALQALSRQYGARRIRVFGSVARRENRTDSDVDFPPATICLASACPWRSSSRNCSSAK